MIFTTLKTIRSGSIFKFYGARLKLLLNVGALTDFPRLFHPGTETVINLNRATFILGLLISVFLMSGCGAVETFEHEVQVEALGTGQPVVEAQVRAEIGVRAVYEAVTDTQGI